jgi:hypothetical protein
MRPRWRAPKATKGGKYKSRQPNVNAADGMNISVGKNASMVIATEASWIIAAY